jgi:hypothetical protein
MIIFELPAGLQDFSYFSKVLEFKSAFRDISSSFKDESVYLKPIYTEPKFTEKRQIEVKERTTDAELVAQWKALSQKGARRIVYEGLPGKNYLEAFENAMRVKRHFPEESVVLETNGRVMPIELHTTPDDRTKQWRRWYPPNEMERKYRDQFGKNSGRNSDSEGKTNLR